MTPETHAFHSRRLTRMLSDLQLDPAALISLRGAIVDDVSRRVLTPGLSNETLADGLVSAVKLAVAVGFREARP
jgi:hypothetical protein